jgi:hypothetical protein
MARAMKVCSTPRCPVLTHGRHCTEHERQVDKARGTRQQRGYTKAHERERRRWERPVQLGHVDCAAPTCVMPTRRILLGQPWDLGHTEDRTTWRGPEHMQCNRGWRRGQTSRPPA